ncbi:MAG: hypothetical protein H0V93_14540 [Euzebyales bacterium]|jgi:hypothetical protein|nr:hypothetical protein [Euzebyales bacterium]
MSKATTTDRKASAAEVHAHAEQVRRLADEVGVSNPRLRHDGTLVVHSDQPGYRQVVALSRHANELVGRYVHVITDDVPAAGDAQPV